MSELPHETREFLQELVSRGEIRVAQRFEVAELLGIETRNAYDIQSANGESLGFAAEQNKGILGFLFRNMLGHWRRFNLRIFGTDRQEKLRFDHPFRFFFQRIEVSSGGVRLGALQQRFGVLSKKFDVQDAQGNVVLEMRSPLWKFWTFPFRRVRASEHEAAGAESARIEKKWTGTLTEIFTDKDRFRVVMSPHLPPAEAGLVLAAAIFIDLQYFEKKGSGGIFGN